MKKLSLEQALKRKNIKFRVNEEQALKISEMLEKPCLKEAKAIFLDCSGSPIYWSNYIDWEGYKVEEIGLNINKIKMKDVIIKVPEGYEMDTKSSTFTCIKFKKKEVKCWKYLGNIKGYVIDIDSTVNAYITEGLDTDDLCNRNVFATKEQAEASIALAMLSQLMKDVNGDWIPDWEYDSNRKYVIHIDKGLAKPDWFYNYSHFLTFPTKVIRDTFLKNHEELIMKAKPLL